MLLIKERRSAQYLLVDSFPCKYMLCLWSLIWSNRVWGSWYLINSLENTIHSSAMIFWVVIFFKLTLRIDCLELSFWKFDFKNHPDSVISQKWQSLSKQCFKHSSANMLLLNLIPNLFFNVYYKTGKRL